MGKEVFLWLIPDYLQLYSNSEACLQDKYFLQTFDFLIYSIIFTSLHAILSWKHHYLQVILPATVELIKTGVAFFYK